MNASGNMPPGNYTHCQNCKTGHSGPSQSFSSLIPVFVVVPLILLGIIGAVSFYACRWRFQHRRNPLKLPKPNPETELPGKSRLSNLCSININGSRILMPPSPSQRKESRERNSCESEVTTADDIYDLPSTYEGDTQPVYENCDISFYENCDVSHYVNLR